MKTLLIIGLTIPEPTTTAAGTRMMQIISLFLEMGYTITFASTANPSERSLDLSKHNILTISIKLNDTSFNDFILDLKPDVVIFDRFIIEEQFGWRVTKQCPDAIRILDTEDLHFLRKARENAVKKGLQIEKADLYTEDTKRELASIYRCDISLIISEFEMDLLQQQFKINRDLLYYLPFIVENLEAKGKEMLPSFEERNDFITVGNFLHTPNVDAVQYLKTKIWPLIRKQLPDARLHIYGSYASEKIISLHDKESGFLMKGWAKDIDKVMKNSRVCLIPLRFGAGLKGKIIDAMINGTPCVSTTVGAEGINGKLCFSGTIVDTVKEFASASVALYSNKTNWFQAQQRGFEIIEERFHSDKFSEAFKENLQKIQNEIIQHRKENFVGQILQHHTLKSTMYLSKWIEEKNK